jgi:(p)ppGpp synthase/HD superfamily hydrolase
MPTISETIAFIETAHDGQEYAPGVPYWKHPVAVLNKLIFISDAVHDSHRFEVEAHAALLHDVLEDTEYTADDLREMGYSEDVLWIVTHMTKDRDMTYEQYICGIVECNHQMKRSLLNVKRADVLVNSEGDKIHMTEERRTRLVKKYEMANELLTEALKSL